MKRRGFVAALGGLLAGPLAATSGTIDTTPVDASIALPETVPTPDDQLVEMAVRDVRNRILTAERRSAAALPFGSLPVNYYVAQQRSLVDAGLFEPFARRVLAADAATQQVLLDRLLTPLLDDCLRSSPSLCVADGLDVDRDAVRPVRISSPKHIADVDELRVYNGSTMLRDTVVAIFAGLRSELAGMIYQHGSLLLWGGGVHVKREAFMLEMFAYVTVSPRAAAC